MSMVERQTMSKKSPYTYLPSDETKIRMLHFMKLVREIEDRIEKKLYRQGRIVGGVYVGRGQEAISVGTAIHMEKDDVVAPSHRDMGVFLMRGVTPRRIIAQYMGRRTGLTRGRDGNMHMGDMNYNVIAFVSHLGDNVPVAAGVALAFKQRGQNKWRCATTVKVLPRAATGTKASTSRPFTSCPSRFSSTTTPTPTPPRWSCKWRSRMSPCARPATAFRAKSWTATTFSRCTTPPNAPSTWRARAAGRRSSNTRHSA